MNADQVKKIIKTFEEKKIPYSVRTTINDTFHNAYNSSVIVWSKDFNSGICIRPNIAPNQAERPLEIRAFDIIDISCISANLKKEEVSAVKDFLDAAGRSDVSQDIYDLYRKQDFVLHSSITGSTGDGVGSWRTNENGNPVEWAGKVSTTPGDTIKY